MNVETLRPIWIAVGNFQKFRGPSTRTQFMSRVSHDALSGCGSRKKARIPFTVLSIARRNMLITKMKSTITVFGR